MSQFRVQHDRSLTVLKVFGNPIEKLIVSLPLVPLCPSEEDESNLTPFGVVRELRDYKRAASTNHIHWRRKSSKQSVALNLDTFRHIFRLIINPAFLLQLELDHWSWPYPIEGPPSTVHTESLPQNGPKVAGSVKPTDGKTDGSLLYYK